MKSFFVIDDNGQGMEEVRTLLRERGYSMTECGPEAYDELRFTRFAIDRSCVQVFWITQDQRIAYVNDAACHALGYSREELTRMSVGDIDPYFPSRDDVIFREHWRALKESGYAKFETSHSARDGRVYPVEIQSNFLEFDGREYGCCFVTDISDRKLAEEKLLLQQFCIEKAGIGIFQISADGEILLANDAACQSLGYSFEELRKLSVFDIDPAITREKVLEISERVDANGSATFETFHRRKDGTIFPVEITANKVDFHGNVHVFSFVKDITERRKAHEALRMSQFIVDKASIGICRGHEDGRILYANEHFARMLGYTREELCSMTYFDIIPDMGEQRWRDHRRLLRAAGSRKFEAVHRRKDGTIFPVEVTVNYLEFDGGAFSCSFTQDITERKRGESALRKSEKKFRLLTEISPYSIIVFRGECIEYANPAAKQFFGLIGAQLRSMDLLSFVHEDFRAIARERLLACMRGEPISTWQEYKIISNRGDIRWVSARCVPINNDGTPAVLATFADITEAKQAEEVLRESEARLKIAMQMAKLAQWEYDVATGMFRCDDQLYALYGTSMDREGGYLVSGESFMKKYVHPDDIPMVMEVTARSLSNRDGTAITRMDHRIIRGDGDVRYMSSLWETIRDQEGRAVRVCGANQDITEQKRAEKAHFAHEKQLAAMTMELSLAEQRERCRIAAELHDGIGQILTLARIRLGLLAKGVCGKEADTPLADIMELVDSANRGIRSLTGQLSPPILEAAGLDAALSWLAGKMQTDYGLSVEFLSDNAPRPLSPEMRGIVYQAVRELLINVVKHAQTDRARLSVEHEGEMLILTVDDHGVGFGTDQSQPVSKEGCFGLYNIHQRMMHLGGEMSIASSPGAGTRIQLRVFLRKTMTKENQF